ncbi:MAG: head-tail connector protein [Planktomarina sp.]
MMLVEETTISAAALPVEQFKAHLRLGTGFADDALQDPVLESFLRAAIAAVEARTGKITLEREFSWSLRSWRDASAQALPIAPVGQLVSVIKVDGDGVEEIQPIADFVLEKDHHRPMVVSKSGTLPTSPKFGTVKLVFLAGFAASFDDLPSDVSQAILLLAAHYYENRSATGMGETSMPFGVSVLLERYKTLRILGGGRS